MVKNLANYRHKQENLTFHKPLNYKQEELTYVKS